MLERDYLEYMLGHFVETVVRALTHAQGSFNAEDVQAVEQEVADVIDLSRDAAMALAPDSLVTMIVLSEVGESMSSSLAFALNKVADLYEQAGQEDLAGLRRLQAEAIAASFPPEKSELPRALAELG